jgi:tRNA threonylcarbamoyladenosine biosynthesis protein TsaE
MYKYSLLELKSIAEDWAKKSEPPFSLLLSGNLGVGKTTFSKFFIESVIFDKTQKITSPTFNIIQIYETKKGPLWHIDLYRIKNESEIFELGLFEAMSEYLCLIEWPEIISKYTKQYNHFSIQL